MMPAQGAAANRRPAGQSNGSEIVSAIDAADRGLRSQRHHDNVSQVLALRSTFHGQAPVAELGR